MGISLAAPYLSEETLDEAERTLREEFFVGGESVEAFESDLCSYLNVDHAVTVDSGTRALQFALEALGIGEGDTVVTTPATFIATANVIVRTGATPRFVDIDLDTYGPDIDELAQICKNESIDAVMPVHLYGYPMDVDNIREAVNDVPIVSDACQAQGAARDGYKIGSKSDVAGMSFYPSKNLTVAGDGGVLLTDDDEIARIAKSLRDVGRSKSGYEHERIGYTARLNTVNAAIGRQQLNQLDEWNERRQFIATQYNDAFEKLPVVRPPSGEKNVHPAWYFYTIRTDDPDSVRSYLSNHEIEAGDQYRIPVHLQPPYQEIGYGEGEFPRAEQWANKLVTLPCHQHMTDEDVRQVINKMEAYFK
jgi:perosamine synthetase